MTRKAWAGNVPEFETAILADADHNALMEAAGWEYRANCTVRRHPCGQTFLVLTNDTSDMGGVPVTRRPLLALIAANLGIGAILAMGVVIIMAAATRWWSAGALAALIIAHLWWSDRGSR